MPELRKDYILDRWVIIATERGKRPHDIGHEKATEEKETCPFCPGNESMTPQEIMRIERNGRWQIRCFPNKYKAASRGSEDILQNEEFFCSKTSVGSHEIIVETRSHKKQLADLKTRDIALVLDTYIQRISSLSSVKDVRYVLVFKNHGKEAGTSKWHSHTQVIAYNNIPEYVQEEINAVSAYKKKHGKCPYCKIIEIESKGPRAIFENKDFVAFAPFASRMPLEAWLFPKKHLKSITEVDNTNMLAELLKKLLLALKKINAPYNFYIHNATADSDLHFHIELLPRLSIPAGFEYGTGTYINIIAPEQAAEFYKRGGKHSKNSASVKT